MCWGKTTEDNRLSWSDNMENAVCGLRTGICVDGMILLPDDFSFGKKGKED